MTKQCKINAECFYVVCGTDVEEHLLAGVDALALAEKFNTCEIV